MKELVQQRKVKTGDELLHQILDAAADRKENCKEPMWPTFAIHRQAKMCIKAEGGHFEQLLLIHE
jgi:hypothetical protein